jgi:hypothetical protein
MWKSGMTVSSLSVLPNPLGNLFGVGYEITVREKAAFRFSRRAGGVDDDRFVVRREIDGIERLRKVVCDRDDVENDAAT